MTAGEIRGWVDESLRSHAEIGFRKLMASVVFEPQSPFDSRARSRPRTEFLILVLLAMAATACFLYFNAGS